MALNSNSNKQLQPPMVSTPFGFDTPRKKEANYVSDATIPSNHTASSDIATVHVRAFYNNELKKIKMRQQYDEARLHWDAAREIMFQLAEPTPAMHGSVVVSFSFKPPSLVSRNSELSGSKCEPGCSFYIQIPSLDSHVAQRESLPTWCNIESLVTMCREKLISDFEKFGRKISPDTMTGGIRGIILYVSQTMNDLIDAAEFYQSKISERTDLAVPRDVVWWADMKIRRLLLLRRLASGLDFILVPQPNHHLDSADALHHRPWTVDGKRITTIELSFLDILLQCGDQVKESAIDAIIKQLVQLQRFIPKLEEKSSKELVLNLQRKLLQILNRSQGTYKWPGDRQIDLARLRTKHLPLLSAEFSDLLDWTDFSRHKRRFLISSEQREENLNIRKEVESLLVAYQQRRATKNERHRRKVRRVGGGRPQNGPYIYTAAEISLQDFLDRAAFMERVNAAIPRPFFPGVSRPVFKQLNLSSAAFDRLKNLFFDADGRLNRNVVQDVDTSRKHGYINFSNVLCLEARNDQRWQVPLRRHSQVIGPVPTRSIVESILVKEGIINPKYESVHDLGLLLGGTQDQSLHHDIARQATAWLAHRPSDDADFDSSNPVPGWEIDRLAYNEAMASSWAPCSVLFGLGDSTTVRIGVQKDQIVRFGPARKQCRVIHGEKDEVLEIIRENSHLVVVSARGCVFTGDFPHAGVKNFCQGSVEESLMNDLIAKLGVILEKHSKLDHGEGTKAVVEMLCNFPGLNKLCRLHFSTELLDTEMKIPRNAIGFVGCFPNPPSEADNDENNNKSPGSVTTDGD